MVSSKLFQLSIVDVKGRTLLSVPFQSKQQLSTRQLSAGTYFYRVTNPEGQIIANGKLIKE